MINVTANLCVFGSGVGLESYSIYAEYNTLANMQKSFKLEMVQYFYLLSFYC